MSNNHIPIDVRHLFKSLDEMLVELLESLTDDEWNLQTIAIKWKVKDVVSHLLDGNLRALSMQRDGYTGEKPVGVHDFQQLVNWLNRLNADWVKATHRISPGVLIQLHKVTGNLVSEYYASLDPWDEAVFAVDWAGEATSYNWMHLAREFTEKWLHQQQIREATGKAGIMIPQYFHPVISTFLLALPHTFRDVRAPAGRVVKTIVTGEVGGEWLLLKEEKQWVLAPETKEDPIAIVEIPAELSWQLFSKSVRPAEVKDQVTISGDQQLGKKVLEMVSVMA